MVDNRINFYKGKRGKTVYKLRYKFGVHPVNDPFDDRLEVEIKKFQEDNGLTVDGIVGPVTYEKIFNVSNITHFAPIGIIVHSMSEFVHYKGEVLKAYQFLRNINLSVHAFVNPDGEVEEMHPTTRKAAHAGISFYQGLHNLNTFFLGFEILIPGTNSYADFVEKIKSPDCYSLEQYKGAIELCRFWMDKYNLTHKDIVRHSDVSGDNIRGTGYGKVDPGEGFNWDYFINELKND